MKTLLNWKSALALVLTAGLLGSCMKSDNSIPPEPTPVANLALYNAYSPIASTQIRFSNKASESVYSGNVPYGQAAQHLPFAEVNDLKVTIRNQSTNQNLVTDAPLNIRINQIYSTFLYGKEIPAKLVLLHDSLVENSSNNSHIRFLNLAEGVEAVDVFLGPDKLENLSNRTPETQTTATAGERFVLSPKAPGPQDILVKSADGTVLAELKAFNFGVKNYYTIVLQGDQASTGDRALKVGVFTVFPNR